MLAASPAVESVLAQEESVQTAEPAPIVQPATPPQNRAQRDPESETVPLSQRLVAVYRRLYVLSPEDRRPGVLMELLGDAEVELRTLGFELARRDLASGATPRAEVIDEAVRLLGDHDATVRRQAAMYIGEAGADRAVTAIAEALERETDPLVATALMRAAARVPTRDETLVFSRWLGAGAEPRQAAIEGLWAAERAGVLTSAEIRTQIAADLRNQPIESLTNAALRLLTRTGIASDRDRVASLLEQDDARRRLLAAEARVEFPDYTRAILNAAESDPALAPAAVRSIAQSEPTAERIQRATRLVFATDAERERSFERLLEASGVREILAAADSDADANARERLASAAITKLPAPHADMDPALLEGAVRARVLLARAQLDLGKSLDALATLDALEAQTTGLEGAAWARERFRALVHVERFDDASRVSATASPSEDESAAVDPGENPAAWIAVIAEIEDETRRADAARFVGFRFDERLDEGQKAKLTGWQPAPTPAERPDDPEANDGSTPSGDAIVPDTRPESGAEPAAETPNGAAIPPAS